MDLPSFPRRAAFVAALLPLALLTACGDDTTDSGQAGSSDRPLVVATTTQLADFASVVGGEDVEVYSVLRPNMDAHDFEASPQDLDALARADVILSNG
jgi:ABC-type Zn uptake system ZnuABC Zn-binding protein ZnuA